MHGTLGVTKQHDHPVLVVVLHWPFAGSQIQKNPRSPRNTKSWSTWRSFLVCNNCVMEPYRILFWLEYGNFFRTVFVWWQQCFPLGKIAPSTYQKSANNRETGFVFPGKSLSHSYAKNSTGNKNPYFRNLCSLCRSAFFKGLKTADRSRC